MAHPSFIGLAIAPTTPAPTLYVFSDCTGNSNCDGLRKSTDGGTTWASAGFPNARVWSVTIAPDIPTTLYAHVDNAGTVGWFKSVDAGTSWTDTNWPVGQLVIDQATPTRLYGLNGYDVLRSLDGGASWSVVLSLPALPFTEDGRYDIRAHSPLLVVAGSTVYALLSAYSVPYCDPDFLGYCDWLPEPATVSYSNDAGSTWNVMVLGYYQVWDLAVHGSTLHAATTPYWDYQHTGAIQSTDGGANWTETDLNIGSTGLRVDTRAVYALTREGLFKRVDGENWTATALAPHPAAVTSLSLNPTNVIVGSSFTGTVTLSAAAPAGGAMVTLSSSNRAVVHVPRFLIFAAGSTAANFTVSPNWATFTTVTISATGTTTRFAEVTVNPPLPHVSIVPNRVGFRTGDLLTVSANVENPGQDAVLDFYFGAVLPDGDTVVFFTNFSFASEVGSLKTPATWRPIAARVNLNTPFIFSQPTFFSYSWTGGEPPGKYLLFVAAVKSGALVDKSIDAGDIVVMSRAAVSFDP